MPTEPRVLIVEEHDALRVMLFTILRHQPLGVDTAASAVEARKKVESCDYALILIDTDLGEEQTGEFLRHFNEVRPEATTFIIAARDPKKEMYIDPEIVSAVVTKPLEIDTLAEIVRECAMVVPPPEDPLPCPTPAESDIRAHMDRGGYLTN